MKIKITTFLRAICLLCLFASISSRVVAQIPELSVPRILPEPPHAAQLAKYISYPVDLSNGLVRISIPIYEIVEGDIRIPITLDYHASGLKPNLRSSDWLGDGWSLSTGPSLSRTINGGADELFYNSTFASSDNPSYDVLKAIQRQEADVALDEFRYSLLTGGGRMYVRNPDQASIRKVVTIPSDPIKVQFPDTGIYSTTITVSDKNGMIYDFGGQDSRYHDYSDHNFGMSYHQVPSSWKIRRIRSSATGKSVNFSYSLPQTEVMCSRSSDFVVMLDHFVGQQQKTIPAILRTCGNGNVKYYKYSDSAQGLVECSLTDLNLPQGYSFPMVSVQNITQNISYPSRIDFSEGYLEFIRGAHGLLCIRVYDLYGSLIRLISFSQTYNSDTFTLKLNSITIQGPEGDITTPETYVFGYDGSAPPRDTRGIDRWGYYNGHEENVTLVPSIDTSAVRTGDIVHITIPGGNRVTTKTFLDASRSSFREQIVFHDMLGRAVETLDKNASTIGGTSQDIVTLSTFDGFGRPFWEYLPVPLSVSPSRPSGTFASQSQVGTASFMFHDWDVYAFSKVLYEGTPLDRPSENYGPGSDWHTHGRSVKTGYFVNASSGNLACDHYRVESSTSLKRTGLFPAGVLSVTEITDEDGHKTYTFKDKLGRTVLERRTLSSSQTADTYYVYDELGLLHYVLSPEASATLSQGTSAVSDSSAPLSNLAYIYKYDSKGRCISRKMPGCEATYLRYDKADRVVFTQDGVRRNAGTLGGGGSYAYDANGNITHDGLAELDLEYNLLNLTKKISAGGTTLANYSYLADGTRISAERNDGTGVQYRGSLIYTKASDGTLSLDCALTSGGRIVRQSGSGAAGTYQVQHFIRDHLGSVRSVVDASTGNVLETSDYLPLGKRWSLTGGDSAQTVTDPTNRWRFSGKEDQTFLSTGIAYNDFGARLLSEVSFKNGQTFRNGIIVYNDGLLTALSKGIIINDCFQQSEIAKIFYYASNEYCDIEWGLYHSETTQQYAFVTNEKNDGVICPFPNDCIIDEQIHSHSDTSPEDIDEVDSMGYEVSYAYKNRKLIDRRLVGNENATGGDLKNYKHYRITYTNNHTSLVYFPKSGHVRKICENKYPVIIKTIKYDSDNNNL